MCSQYIEAVLKGWFHEPTNHTHKRKQMVGGSKLIGRPTNTIHFCIHTVVANILVAYLLKFVIVFDMTGRPPGRHLFPFADAYVAPRLKDEYL